MPDMTRVDPPGRSAVAEIGPTGDLLGVQMCNSNAEIAATVGASPALVVIDAPVMIPPDTNGRRDMEHVLAWLDIPAFPVTPARMVTVHGGARGATLAALLPPAQIVVEVSHTRSPRKAGNIERIRSPVRLRGAGSVFP